MSCRVPGWMSSSSRRADRTWHRRKPVTGPRNGCCATTGTTVSRSPSGHRPSRFPWAEWWGGRRWSTRDPASAPPTTPWSSGVGVASPESHPMTWRRCSTSWRTCSGCNRCPRTSSEPTVRSPAGERRSSAGRAARFVATSAAATATVCARSAARSTPSRRCTSHISPERSRPAPGSSHERRSIGSSWRGPVPLECWPSCGTPTPTDRRLDSGSGRGRLCWRQDRCSPRRC